jgi:choice-of-anchor A domain-containing protein
MVSISKDRNNIVSGTVVTYTITVENPAKVGTIIGCDITLGPGGLLFHCPAADGTTNGTMTTLIPANTPLPAGFGPATFTVQCTVVLNAGVQSAEALVDAPGALLHDNTLRDDLANINKTVSVNVFTPCIAVTKQCVNPCTPYGQPIQFSGTVTNCGDIVLTGVTVVDNHAGTVLGPIVLQPGGTPGSSANYSGSYTPTGTGTALCGPLMDTVTATGTAPVDPTPVTTSATATAACRVCTSPCISVTKTCPSQIPCGTTSYIASGVVINCGDVPLNNITVVDSDGTTLLALPTLAVGGSQPYSGTIKVPAGTSSGPISDTVTASGNDSCTAKSVTANASCTTTLLACPPAICVNKQIACFLGTNSAGNDVCGTFNHSATGFKVVTATATNLPAFCYRITVSNCGAVALTNVSIIDDQFGPLTGDFSCLAPVFAVGASCSFEFKTSLASDLTNTVTASGQSSATGQRVSAVDQAVGHVFQASIGCTKLVTSPDDVDGNPDDSHVSFPCGSGLHEVTYSLFVTNNGDADLTNIVISDPALARVCTLPGPFALPAHESLTIPLCGPVPFDCGTGSSGSSGSCGNPILGTATGCTVLELGPHSVSITGPPGGIQGNVCIAAGGKLSITGSEFVTGNIELGPGATYSKSGSGTIGGTVQTGVDLSSEISQALAASSLASSLPCTQTFSQLNSTQAITGTVGTNVICVSGVVLNSATITLTGPAGAKFIMNVKGKFTLNGTSHIVVAGGVRASDVLYNIIGTGEAVAFTGGGGGTACCNSSVDGTLLAVQRVINLSPGLVNGQVISGQDISIVSGSSVRCPPGCTPISMPNIVTITAEIASSQSNTNLNPACVFNVNGQPITASSQCSALVECNK